MFRKIVLFLIIISLVGSAFANPFNFEGTITTFKELGLNDFSIIKKNNIDCKEININNWTALKKEEGILGLFLHAEINDEDAFISIRDSEKKPISHKSLSGVNIAFNYKKGDFQKDWLFIPLEQIRNKEGKINICASFSKEDGAFIVFDDSEIGAYKIPYFECGSCFTKKPLKNKYKTGEKTPIIVKFKNKGYKDANIFVYYDNEIFTRNIQLKEGQPSWQGTLKPNEDANIIYYFVPLLADNFVISPAVMHYNFNGYVFNTLSNPIIVGTSPYLDTIYCDVIQQKYNYNLNEDAKTKVFLYNDSAKQKKLTLQLDCNILKKEKEISLKPKETKKIEFIFNENKEKIFNCKILLIKDKKQKQCNEITFGFIKKEKNNIIYFTLIFVLLAIGIGIYYYKM